jgi:hypothetical protein
LPLLLSRRYGTCRKDPRFLKGSLMPLRPQNSCPSSLGRYLIWPAPGHFPATHSGWADGRLSASACLSWRTPCPNTKSVTRPFPLQVERTGVGSTRTPRSDNRNGEVSTGEFAERSAGSRPNLGVAV